MLVCFIIGIQLYQLQILISIFSSCVLHSGTSVTAYYSMSITNNGNHNGKNVLTVMMITQCCLCKKSKRIPSDHSSCRIRSLKANKRDYAVDKLGDDRSAHHSGNESVLANGRVGAVPLLLSASTSACERGCFSEIRVAPACGRSENNSNLALGETRENGDKKRFLCFTYI